MKLSLLQSYLLAERLVGRDELQRVEAERVARGLTLPGALLALKVLDAEALAGLLARRFKLPRIDAVQLTTAKAAHELEPTFALEHRVLPVARDGDLLTLVMSDPTDSETAEEVERRTGATVLRAVALESSLDAALAQHYGGGSGLRGDATGELRELFGASMNVVTQPLRQAEVPIPLTRRKVPAPPAPPLDPQSTDHLENLVTAPLPRIDFTPEQQESPPLPTKVLKPPPLPDLDDPPPLPPDALAGANTLVDELPDEAWSASQLQKWALDWLAQLARRALIFRVEGVELRGWAAAGLGGDRAPTLGLTIDEQSLFSDVLRTGEVYVGPLPFGPTARRFAALIGRHPRELLLAPVSDAQGPLGLVYCDDLHAAVRPRELEGFIKRLAEHLRRGDKSGPMTSLPH